MISIFLRSLTYNVLFYVHLVLWLVVALPTFVLPRAALMTLVRLWSRQNTWLLRIICNVKVEYRGVGKIPKGPLVVASKHQSMWETFALLLWFDRPLYILKRELTRIPFFGWYTIKAGMIAVDRSAGGRALLKMVRQASEEVRNNGRQLIIFPEGTRKAPGAPPDYKPGVAQLYASCREQCLPVALNSGLFWPRRTFMRYPGTLVVEFLDPVPPGLPRDEFLARISAVIEEATARLVEAARQEQAQLFGGVPDSASANA
ncbi:MAG TPA: 1-acyl-sn-glycerol-3-phosphate acyltransferase [Bradyrhizobium sp.]|uniref:lysophospholipid acyltransferase family protein n=1 Tax=Bradyrhizobium sp. TaxID=376 RepID=UPI002D7EADB9|nr:1-acyl-sn-glycerol-3-phosphate acyltransferase [Bradyrhizobium sp.]HET7885453.1 1-acyl-sn-glycerol-3-phosphate acyltransferase [Bradyrhizobium sp.]